MPARARPSAVLLVAVALAAAGCGRSASEPAEPAESTSGAPTITIESFVFQPGTLRARVGDTVTVTNRDGTDHTATADDGSFDTGRFGQGTRTFTLTKAGSVSYTCQVHSYMYMEGTIQVAP